MAYYLTADVEDIGRTEAKALVAAILKKHGLDLVEEECKRVHAEADKRKAEQSTDADVAMAS